MKVFIEGRVQGVGYRMYVRGLAYQYKVGGWVRNRDDGRVVAEIEGERAIVERVVEAMYARGSHIIRVDRVSVIPISPIGEHGFEIR